MQAVKNNIFNYYKDKTVLITGATGYIGSALLSALSYVPCNIVALVKNGESLEVTPGVTAKISSIEADICSEGVWDELLGKIDILFHFAAQTSSKFANEHPLKDLEINLLPIASMIDTCQKNAFSPDIIFSGTVTEVGFTKNYPIDEAFKDSPITIYDIDKLAAEKYLLYYSSQLKGRAVILRLPNVYGPGPKSSSADRGILNAMIKRALNSQVLTIYGDGNFVRDYIYIDDVVKAFLMAAVKIEVLKGDYYIIGSGIGHTIKEAFSIIRDKVVEKTGTRAQITHISMPEGLSWIEHRNFVADTSKFNALTGWTAEVTLKEGIRRTIEYYLKEKGR